MAIDASTIRLLAHQLKRDFGKLLQGKAWPKHPKLSQIAQGGAALAAAEVPAALITGALRPDINELMMPKGKVDPKIYKMLLKQMELPNIPRADLEQLAAINNAAYAPPYSAETIGSAFGGGSIPPEVLEKAKQIGITLFPKGKPIAPAIIAHELGHAKDLMNASPALTKAKLGAGTILPSVMAMAGADKSKSLLRKLIKSKSKLGRIGTVLGSMLIGTGAGYGTAYPMIRMEDTASRHGLDALKQLGYTPEQLAIATDKLKTAGNTYRRNAIVRSIMGALVGQI